MNKPTKRTLAVASAALLTFAGGAYAVASSSAPTAITSSVTDKIDTAIAAKYPGATVVGIRSNDGGTFEVEVRKTDGTEVHVSLDASFKITAENAGGFGRGGRGFGGPGGGFDHGGPGPVDTAALAKSLGVSEDKLTAAIDKVRTSLADAHEADEVAAIAKALNASSADVKAVLDAQQSASGKGQDGGPGFGGHRGGDGDGPGSDALVTALAKKLGTTEAKVRAALQSARPDHSGDPSSRQDDLASALAKALGLDASKVKTAIAAQRPSGPPAGQPTPTTPAPTTP